MKFRQINTLPTPGHGCNTAFISTRGTDLDLNYVYETDHGTAQIGKIRFGAVVAFRFHDETHAGYPSESYDSIAESDDSDWLQQLRARVPDARWPFARRHYAVYLRNKGLYEVVAETCTEHPPTPFLKNTP